MDQDDEDLLLLFTFVATALQTTAPVESIIEGAVVPQSHNLTLLLESPSDPLLSRGALIVFSDVVIRYLADSAPQLGYGCYLPADDLYTRFTQNPGLIKSYTNFFPPAFEELFVRVQPFISVPIDIRGNRRAAHLQLQPRAVGPSGRPIGRPPKLTLRTRFMIFLAVLRGGMSLIDQIAGCGQNQQGLSDDFYHMLHGVLEALDDEIRWPTAAERLALRGSIWDFPATSLMCPIFLCDGTIQKVHSPQGAAEPLMYCSRKKVHGFNHQIVCQWDGRIVAVYTGFNGCEHDSVCYRMLPLYSQRDQYFSGNETLIGDCGYQGCGVMHVRPERAGGSRADMEYNRLLRRHRVLIEFVIGAVKNKFAIVQKPWARGGSNLPCANDAFFVCCQLFNFWMAKYGYLRGAAYRQRHALEAWERQFLAQVGGGARQGWDIDECMIEMIFDGGAPDIYTMLENAGVV